MKTLWNIGQDLEEIFIPHGQVLGQKLPKHLCTTWIETWGVVRLNAPILRRSTSKMDKNRPSNANTSSFRFVAMVTQEDSEAHSVLGGLSCVGEGGKTYVVTNPRYFSGPPGKELKDNTHYQALTLPGQKTCLQVRRRANECR